MAVFFTVNDSNEVTNLIESESALLPEWIAVPSGQEPDIRDVWNSSTQTFTKAGAPSLSAAENEQEAKRLLLDSDWTQLADVGLTLTNLGEWRTYRASLRAIAKAPTAGALTWPTVPNKEYE